MKKINRKILFCLISFTTLMLLAACTSQTEKAKDTNTTIETTASSKKIAIKEVSKGQALTKILTQTNWQGTKVYDQNKVDLTAENMEFIGLAKYDAETNYYEFFDKVTGESRGDEGTFFITADGEKRILISATKGYQGIVGMTELTNKIFTYKRMGKDREGQPTEVFVEHIPYGGSLSFTHGRSDLPATTKTIEQDQTGVEILGKSLWQGTKVLTEDGRDVTAANKMFISLAKFSATTSKYEFFDLASGESRGDFGYFDVLANNHLRAHVSISDNKYGAVLPLRELTESKFTYQRQGKDENGNEVTVFVEHEPYTGKFKPEFTF